MRGVAVASVVLLFALAGCMGMQPSDDDWDAYDSGRGLAFGMALSVLLIVGVVVLIVNLTSSGRREQAASEATATPSTATGPGMAPPAPLSGGWETVRSSAPPSPSSPSSSPAPARKAAAKRTTPSAKPRRPAP